MTPDKETAIDKIHRFQRFGSILGLERMNELLELLERPQDDLRVIHVAGTNGKGSCCRYIYSVLCAAGYKTGIYISPFIETFNERIEISGKKISDEELSAYTERVLEAVKKITDMGHDSPTEFEVITAIAMLYYKEQHCDYVVLEVGLGGRGDSTNVCEHPLMTVITSISMDHTDRLGNTIEEIAEEKAGIIKQGCPVVTSVSDERALQVIRKTAGDHNSPVFETSGINAQIEHKGPDGSRFDVIIDGEKFSSVEISMAGRHQIENAVTAMCAIKIMQEAGVLSLSEKALYEGLKSAVQPGRMETFILKDNTRVIIDGAHNPDGARALADFICEEFPHKKILAVTGILADKDVEGILSQFTRITKDFVVTEPDNPRRMDAAELALKLKEKKCICKEAPDIRKACNLASGMADRYDLIIFAGSLYMIGKVRTLLRKGEL